MSLSTPAKKKSLLLAVSILLMSILMANGILLSRHKPLWNDEIYTQTHIIETSGYLKILSGKIHEGNNFPLFYVLQKTFLKINAYRFPIAWDGEWEIYAPKSQVLLRILPNIFMSSAIVAMFLYFWQTFGLVAGLMTSGLALSSPAVWGYWAEARPYSLWFLLTTLQNLAILRFRNDTGKEFSSSIFHLSIIHAMLCLTIPTGLLQTLVASLVIVFLKIKKTRAFLPLLVIPLCLWTPYWLAKMNIKLHMTSPWRLILDNVPPEQWFVFALYVVLGCWTGFKQRYTKQPGGGRPELSTAYLPYFISVFVIAAALLLYLFVFNSQTIANSFEISSRYFIFLVPSGVIMTVFIFLDLYALARKSGWQRFNVVLLGCGLLATQTMNALITVLKAGVYH